MVSIATIKKDELKFKVYAPMEHKSIDLNDDGTLTIVGIASTTNRDLQDEVVTQDAMNSMLEQAEKLNLHGDHSYSLEGIIGSIKEAAIVNETELKIKAVIRKKYAPEIKDLLDIDVNLGLSIGGIPQFKGQEIIDIRLLEISLTGMPANWDTFGTVEVTKGLVTSNCIGKACYKIKKEVNKMADDGNQTGQTGMSDEAKQECTDLFNELMNSQKEEIKKDVLDNVKADMEKRVEDKVKELTDKNNTPPGDDNVDDNTDDMKSMFEAFGKDLIEQIGKQTDERILNHVKNMGDNPEETKPPINPNPNPTGKKTYSNEEIIKNIQARHEKNSIFHIANPED